jgi:hypothetical protein
MQQRVTMIRLGLFALSQAYAGQITADMRRNARWRNQSGAARSGLHAIAFQRGDEFGIEAAHTVDYGRWLELGIGRWENGPDVGFRERTTTGRMGYPIIANTMRDTWPHYLDACRDVLRRAGATQIG